MRQIAVIPARGASKRIPRKNVADLAGRPLIAWTIEAARGTGAFARVVVSTDDAEIADVARRHGADVPFLRASYGDDHSPVSLATVETLERLADEGDRYEVAVQLLPTCPLRNAEDVTTALAAFHRSERVFQISCFEFDWSRPWWAVRLDAEGRPDPLFPKERFMRSQDLPPLYCPTGATWVARADRLLEERTFYGTDHRYEPMPWLRALDIDVPEDLEMARRLIALR